MVSRSTAAGEEYSVLERGGACFACKRRKKRCDGQKPICGQCIRLNVENECAFPSTPPPPTSSRTAGAKTAKHARTGSDNSHSSGSYHGSPSASASASASDFAVGAAVAPTADYYTSGNVHYPPASSYSSVRQPEIYLSTPEGEGTGGSISPASGAGSSLSGGAGGSSSGKRKRWSSGGEDEYDDEAEYSGGAAGAGADNSTYSYVASSSGLQARPFLKVPRTPPRYYSTSSGAPSTYAASEPSPGDTVPSSAASAYLYGTPTVFDNVQHRVIPPQSPEGSTSYPPTPTHEHMLESFILHRERCGVEIDPDSFRQRMALPANSPGAVHPVLVTAVYMTACYFEHLNGVYGWGDHAEVYYNQISHQLMAALHSPNMNSIDDIIRASGLLCWYSFVRGRVVEANYHASGALRLIGNKTINSIDGRPPTSSSSPVSPGTMPKYEERLAIFWQIYMLDRYPSLLSHSDPTMREELVENLLPRPSQLWTQPRLEAPGQVQNNLPMFDPQVRPQSDLAIRVVCITALERAVRLSRSVRHTAERAPHLLGSVLRDLKSLAGMLQDLHNWLPPVHASSSASPSSSHTVRAEFGFPSYYPSSDTALLLRKESPHPEEISLLLQQPVPKFANAYMPTFVDPHHAPAGAQPNPYITSEHANTVLGLQLERPASPFSRPTLIYAHSAMNAAVAIVKQCATKLETLITPPHTSRPGLLDHASFVRDTSLLSSATSIVQLLGMLGPDYAVKEIDITIAVSWDTAAKVLANHVRNSQHSPAIDSRGHFAQQNRPQGLSEPHISVASNVQPAPTAYPTPTTPTVADGWYDALAAGHQLHAGPSIAQLMQQYYALNSALDKFQATYSVIRYIRTT